MARNAESCLLGLYLLQGCDLNKLAPPAPEPLACRTHLHAPVARHGSQKNVSLGTKSVPKYVTFGAEFVG